MKPSQPHRNRAHGVTGVLASVAVLGLVIALAGNPGAAANPVLGGTTILNVKRWHAPNTGADVKPIPPAAQHTGGTKGGAIVLPNTGGDFDPATGAGSVATSGGYQLKLLPSGKPGGPKVRVTDLVLTFSPPSGTVSGTVDGKTVDPLGTLAGYNVVYPPDGSTVIAGKQAKIRLTQEGAKAFKKLAAETGGYEANDALGSFREGVTVITTP